MKFHDQAYNYYNIKYNGEYIMERTGILEGCVEQTWVADPIEPNLYIIKRDGSGYEILKNNEYYEYDRQSQYHQNSQKIIDSDVFPTSCEKRCIRYEYDIGVDRDELYEVYNKTKLPIQLRKYENIKLEHIQTYRIYRSFYEVELFNEEKREEYNKIVSNYKDHVNVYNKL